MSFRTQGTRLEDYDSSVFEWSGEQYMGFAFGDVPRPTGIRFFPQRSMGGDHDPHRQGVLGSHCIAPESQE